MGDLWGVLLVLGLAAPLIGAAAAVAWLVWRADRPRFHAVDARHGQPPFHPAVVRLFTWGAVTTALVLPWSVAIAVKLVLEHRGLPTLPWSYFLSPGTVLLLIPVTLFLWAFPFLLLAVFARYVCLGRAPDRATFRERLVALCAAYACGVAAGGFVYWGMFREFDILYVFVPVGAYVGVPMLVGGLLAWSGIVLLRRTVARRSPPVTS